jgi:hypothetical protein
MEHDDRHARDPSLVKMGRTAHVDVRPAVDDPHMDDPGVLHRIEDDLSETWVEEFAADGVAALEAYLAKHLAFLSFLEDSPSV